jgi:hypothetical protein
MAIIPPITPNLNPGNMHGGPFTASTVGAVANAGNTQYGAGGSAASLAGKGLYSVSGSSGPNGSPSAVHKPMSGGSARRRHRHRHSRARSSKKYARKHSLKYRVKHKRSRRHSHSRKIKKVRAARGQRGGYHQYMGNTPFTLGFRTPGFNLAPNMSALANPAPFMPYNSLTGGR